MIETTFVARRKDAIIGSEMLRDAILHAKGYPAPPTRTRIRPRGVVPRSQSPRHIPACCDKCGSPLNPIIGMVSHIQARVCAYYGLQIGAMVSARRHQGISHPRQIAMYLASEFTPKSLPELGRRFGGRDHTTVIHAIKAVKRRMMLDPEIAEDVRVLSEALAG